MSIINNVLHARALQEFGRGYLSPTRNHAVLAAIFKRIDEAEAHAKQMARELELMHDIAISHSGRVEELEAGIRGMVAAGGDWRREAKAHHILVRLLADSRGTTEATTS